MLTSIARVSATGGGRSGSGGLARSNSGTRAQSGSPAATNEETAPAPVPVPAVVQEPIVDEKMTKAVKYTIDQSLINPDDDELVAEVKQRFPPQYHAAVIATILNVVLEK